MFHTLQPLMANAWSLDNNMTLDDNLVNTTIITSYVFWCEVAAASDKIFHNMRDQSSVHEDVNKNKFYCITICYTIFIPCKLFFKFVTSLYCLTFSEENAFLLHFFSCLLSYKINVLYIKQMKNKLFKIDEIFYTVQCYFHLGVFSSRISMKTAYQFINYIFGVKYSLVNL